MNFVKAYLQKKPIGPERIMSWVISTSRTRAVSILGQEVSASASFSTWDGTPKVQQLTHTVFLNCNDELAEQYKELANGSTFYLGISDDEDEPIVVLTPAQYKEQTAKANADVSSQEQDFA